MQGENVKARLRARLLLVLRMKTWKEGKRMRLSKLRRRSLVESNSKRLVRKDAISK
jgi:hypothetical protein